MRDVNGARVARDDARGGYESWFLRGNHPERPLAFWIRYTTFIPAGRSRDGLGELWAVFFDGERGRRAAVRQAFPLKDQHVGARGLEVAIGGGRLTPGAASGSATNGERTIAWDLGWASSAPPLLLLPEAMYGASFPKAKSLVAAPLATFSGVIVVDGEPIAVAGYRGSQNHNWGERHTDVYAWGQVMGFPEAPETCLELATAQVKVGPLLTPKVTLGVVRHGGRELRFDALRRGLGRATLREHDWRFTLKGPDGRVEGRIWADAAAFACLRYKNPPGGDKFCLNTKLAACELEITPAGGPTTRIATPHGAAFEELSDAPPPGAQVVF